MNNLKNDVYNSVISLHKKTGKEWIHLKEIYEEVSNLRNEELKNNGSSVSAILETHCISSDAFKGEEKFVIKEKGTGLYKVLYYDKLKVVENINIGETFTREQLMSTFKISGQRGMMKTNSLNALVLTTSDNSVYEDSLVENGIMIYTGEGLEGDQKLSNGNKSLYESKDSNLPVYLFTKNKERKYTFEGEVELDGKPYQVSEKDINEEDRLVWKFPLRVQYSEDSDYEKDETINKFVHEIIEVENIEPGNYGLIYKDGLPNIRKYRKTGMKNQRTSKPDYITDQITKAKLGVINGKSVYEDEIKRMMELEAEQQVELMKKFFENKKENEGYDILSFEKDVNGEFIEKYIEVKSTKGNEGTPIDITADEIEFAKKHVDNYYLYRIIYSDREDRYVKVITGRELLDNFKLIPTTFKIYAN